VEYLVADYLQWSGENENDQSAPDGREREVDVGILGFHGLSALSNLLSDVLNLNDRLRLHNVQ
jgi:hypothetical protein